MESTAMKISARNRFTGTVTAIETGAVNSTVRIDVGGGNVITAMITNDAVADLGLSVGGQAHAVIKASDVLVAADD